MEERWENNLLSFKRGKSYQGEEDIPLTGFLNKKKGGKARSKPFLHNRKKGKRAK